MSAYRARCSGLRRRIPISWSRWWCMAVSSVRRWRWRAGSRNFGFNGADNGSISRVVIHEERMIVRGFNDVAHL